MNNIDKLICFLMALHGFCKDLHYNIPDYSIHLFADRVQDGLDEFIDEIKENYILAKGNKPQLSSLYFSEAAKLVPNIIELEALKSLLLNVLEHLEVVKAETIGDGDLLGRIGNNLQNSLGVLNILENK